MAFACLLPTIVLRAREYTLFSARSCHSLGRRRERLAKRGTSGRQKTARLSAPFCPNLFVSKFCSARRRQIGLLVPFRRNAMGARLGGLARRAFGRRRIGAVAAYRGEMREEAAGADARIVRHALHDADQHVAFAVELGDRAA